MIIKRGDAVAKALAVLDLEDRTSVPQRRVSTKSATGPKGAMVPEMAEPEVRRAADRLLQQAQERSGLIEREAYEKGYAHGEQAGMELATKKAEALLERYISSLTQLGRTRNDVLLQLEKDVVKLAAAIAKKIIHREIQADPEIILTMVRIALSRVGEKSLVNVRLNPVDFKFVADNKARLGTPSELAGITLIEDHSIARGGCLLDTEAGSIDARVDEQLREIEFGLLGS